MKAHSILICNIDLWVNSAGIYQTLMREINAQLAFHTAKFYVNVRLVASQLYLSVLGCVQKYRLPSKSTAAVIDLYFR